MDSKEIEKQTKAAYELAGIPEAQRPRIDVLHGKKGGYDIRVKRQYTSDSLQWYFENGYISGKQRHAGRLLRRDAHHCRHYAPKGIDVQERVDGSPRRGLSESQLEARARMAGGLLKISNDSGNVWSKAAGDVAIRGYWLKDLIYLPKRKQTERFAECMEVLAEYYLAERR